MSNSASVATLRSVRPLASNGDVVLFELHVRGETSPRQIVLLRDALPEKLILALQTDASAYLPEQTGALHPVEAVSPELPPCRLTPHETRLLKLLVEGHSYKTAAAALGVSRHTVSFHLRRLYQKLDVHSKSEAVSKAWRARLI